MPAAHAGQVVVLNGAPRSGKSSVAAAIQQRFPEPWMNLGVDVFTGRVIPPRLRPGIGLRPGGELPELEALVPVLYAALYESVAAHSRLGLNVVVDVGHHDGYGSPRGILPDCARRLAGLPVLFVGVRCPIGTILERRRAAPADVYAAAAEGAPVPAPILAWQRAVHDPGLYDLEVDTSALGPDECAELIAGRLREGVPRPTAFERLARR